MFLRKTKKPNGRVFLAIAENYRDRGRTRQRTVESLGYLDELEREIPDPVAHYEAYAAELTERKAAGGARAAVEFDPREKVPAGGGDRVGLGSVPLSYCYHALQLDRFWNGRKARAGLPFDPNAVFRMLSYQRVLAPGSKRAAWEARSELPDRCDFSLDHVYRALSFFASHEEAFKAHVDRALGALAPRPGGDVCYDVTNYYFEVDDEDPEGGGLRARGVSKEHRPQPIVQMGLMTDSRGMPIDYELWRGSTVDCQTMLPALRRAKARHPGQRVVVVADKGLNTSANIAEAVAGGDGFIFSQSVRKASKGLREWVLDEGGYEGDGEFRIKSRQSHRSVKVRRPDGATGTERVDVQEVAFWSRDFSERARLEREKVVEKSARALARGGVGAAKAKTGLRYVKDLAYDAGTGEQVAHAYELDSGAIERDARCDGYYCLVTSEWDAGEREVVDRYRQLWRVEETFRVTKSTLECRPVFVWTDASIRAHFMVCYAALVMVRLLQDLTGWRYSADAVQDALASLVGYHECAEWYLFANRSECADEMGRLLGVELNRRRYTRGDIRQMMADSRKPGYGIWLKDR